MFYNGDINNVNNNNYILVTFTVVKHLHTLPILFLVILKGYYYHSSFSDGIIMTQ